MRKKHEADSALKALSHLPIALAAALVLSSPALAVCPIELSTYRDTQNVASVEFRPTGENATVTNSFRMILGETVLDGIVMWSDGVARPNGILTYKCPLGDVTGQEMEACTLWQGVIYTADNAGTIGLLPAEGAAAPEKLIFSDLAFSLRAAPANEMAALDKLPSDVFALSGCQE